MVDKKSKMWLPLEANPKVFTDFAEKLGFPTIMFGFHDVYALDAEVWLCGPVPQPVIAVILLYQIKRKHDDLIKSQLESQLKDKEDNKSEKMMPLFIKQTIGNACGTIALLHALCNTLDHSGGIREESFLESFM